MTITNPRHNGPDFGTIRTIKTHNGPDFWTLQTILEHNGPSITQKGPDLCTLRTIFTPVNRRRQVRTAHQGADTVSFFQSD
jgi:hypothetical protein